MLQQIQQLQAERNHLQQQVNANLKIKTPDTYHGERTKLDAFLGSLELYFSTRMGMSDSAKTLFAGSYMRDAAADWFKPYLDEWTETGGQPTGIGRILTDYEQFKEVMQQYFGDTDQQRTTERKLLALKQRGSASDYAAKFQQLLMKAGWDNNTTNMSLFEQGLKPEVQYEVVKNGPYDTIGAMIANAVRIDNQLYNLRQMKRTPAYTANIGRQKKPKDPYGPMPMELDSVQKVDDTEKEQLRRKNQCFYCRKEGHFARNCYKRKEKGQPTQKLRATQGYASGKKPRKGYDITEVPTDMEHVPKLRATMREPDPKDMQEWVDAGNEFWEETKKDANRDRLTTYEQIQAQEVDEITNLIGNEERNRNLQEHYRKTWEECEERMRECLMEDGEILDYPTVKTTCDYHWEKKIEEIKDEKHPRHEEYPLWACECERHRDLQKLAEILIETDVDHPEHGLRGCQIKECTRCDDTDEEDYQELPNSQDLADTRHPQHERIHWTFCYDDQCPIHLDGKNSGYFPRAPKKLRATTRVQEKDMDMEIQQQLRQETEDLERRIQDRIDKLEKLRQHLNEVTIDIVSAVERYVRHHTAEQVEELEQTVHDMKAQILRDPKRLEDTETIRPETQGKDRASRN